MNRNVLHFIATLLIIGSIFFFPNKVMARITQSEVVRTSNPVSSEFRPDIKDIELLRGVLLNMPEKRPIKTDYLNLNIPASWFRRPPTIPTQYPLSHHNGIEFLP